MAALGFLCVAVMFLCCFAAVHIIKLAKIGLDSLKRRQGEEKKPEPEPEKKPAKQQAVYYIVEKKRARRASYGAPREISFAEDKKKAK